MKTKAVFFDLDGTLLPMDQEIFVKDYLGRLAAYLVPYGYEAKAICEAVMEGVVAMVKNDGSITNEESFWKVFKNRFGEEILGYKEKLEEFYRTEFQKCSASCGFAAEAKEIIQLVKKKGLMPVLATNPLFPQIATHSRIRWAGLDREDFAYISTYENSTYCKPNPLYYRQLLDKLGLKAQECIMVGNDAREDTVPAQLGMPVFLLTDCLISRGEDISAYPQGDFNELKKFIEEV